MKFFFILIGLLASTIDVHTQPFLDSLYIVTPKIEKRFTFGIRGKIAGFVIVEDIFVSAVTVGSELWYRDRHSIGIDVGKLNWRFESDDDKDKTMYQQYKRRKYIFADYRYCFLHKKLTWWYVNAYHKTGRYDMHYKREEYDFGGRDMSFLQSNTHGHYREEGLGIGAKFFFESSADRFCLDLTMNCGWRHNKDDIREVLDVHHDSTIPGFKSDDVLFTMRWNLCYLFR